MNIVIYTKPNCPNCDSAKKLLKANGLPFDAIDVVIEPDAFSAMLKFYPDARQMPQVFIGDQRVGGLAGLQAALKQMGL